LLRLLGSSLDDSRRRLVTNTPQFHTFTGESANV
jgi:hypothetical protein